MTPDPTAPASPTPRRGKFRPNEDATDGRSEIGPIGAMRARDVARPTPADEADAERDVVVVRRGWRPPEEPPAG